MNETTLSNVLIHQKDKLRRLVFNGEYEQAAYLLEFVKEFWEASRYGYKYRETREFITNSVQCHIDEADHWKEREKWVKLLERLYPTV